MAEHSRFSSPAGMRLAGKFVSNSMNGMLRGEKDRKAAAVRREPPSPLRFQKRDAGRGVERGGAAKLLIGRAASAILDWLSGLLLFCNHVCWLQIT